MILKVHSIILKRNNQLLFKNFSLNLQNSQIIILRGENGVGKSSLLLSIIGLIDLESGYISIDGIHSNKINANKSELFFFLGHDNCLKENLTVLENLKIWTSLINLRLKDKDIIKKLHYFNINNFFDYPIKNLSEGQKRRVALSKLLFVNSNLWVLDEPTNGLDNNSETLFEKLLETHQNKGGAVILSSHNNFKLRNHKVVKINKIKSEKTSEIVDWNDL